MKHVQISFITGIPIKFWTEDLIGEGLIQAHNIANLPFVFSHIAIMPDAHLGYGMPIGGVLATKGIVIPNAVGMDKGCGVCAFCLGIHIDVFNKETLRKIMSDIRQKIPVGFKKHKKPQIEYLNLMPVAHSSYLPVVTENIDNATLSLGTLGGGNHFIEFQKDEAGFVWVMIHSGSRNLGLQVNKYYNNLAKEKNAEWFSNVPEAHDLAFLPADSKYGKQYLLEMEYCVQFARTNRAVMMDVVCECVEKYYSFVTLEFPINTPSDMIDVAHNYAVMEHHFGENVMVHRKGATRAYKGELGLIPGSQGTNSYIVRGLGNIHSFKSCSHGAGRQMGRKAATRELDLNEQKKILDDKGIIHSIRSQKDLDEAPGAYKNIDEVMENQKDLVEIVHKLTPIAVIKG